MSSRLSKPNIFILQNRWDISVGEDDPEEVEQVQTPLMYHFAYNFKIYMYLLFVNIVMYFFF